MKIRTGFVSNSSSSSFLAYGAWVSEEEMLHAANSHLKEGEDPCKMVYEACDCCPLETWCPEGYDEVFVGYSWDSVADDQTGKQFKQEIEKALFEWFGKEIKCSTGEAAWYS
jgi:hypothetical protein